MIQISSYNDRLELIEIEFRFLRFAVSSLQTTKKHKFFSNISREHLNRLDAGLKIDYHFIGERNILISN